MIVFELQVNGRSLGTAEADDLSFLTAIITVAEQMGVQPQVIDPGIKNQAQVTVGGLIHRTGATEAEYIDWLNHTLNPNDEVKVLILRRSAVDGPKSPDPQALTFGKWLRQKWKKRMIVVPSIGTAVVAAFGGYAGLASAMTRGAIDLFQSSWFRPILFGAQAIVCAFLIFLVPPLDPNKRVRRRVRVSVEHFREAWKSLWVYWVFLYVVFFFREIGFVLSDKLNTCRVLHFELCFDPKTAPLDWCKMCVLWEYGWGWALNIFTNLQSLSFVILYWVITKSTVRSNDQESKRPWKAAIAILAIISSLDAVVTLFAISPIYHEPSQSVHHLLSWAFGLFAGIAMALVVGRFDSKYIDPPTWCVVLFYFYALIQAPWGAFENKVLETVLVSLALPLKCLMFLFVAWLLDTRILFFFVDRVATLITDARKERDAYVNKVTLQE